MVGSEQAETQEGRGVPTSPDHLYTDGMLEDGNAVQQDTEDDEVGEPPIAPTQEDSWPDAVVDSTAPAADPDAEWTSFITADADEDVPAKATAYAEELRHCLHARRAGGYLETFGAARFALSDGEFETGPLQAQPPGVSAVPETSRANNGPPSSTAVQDSSLHAEAATLQAEEAMSLAESKGSKIAEELILALSCEIKEPARHASKMTHDQVTLRLTDVAARLAELPPSDQSAHRQCVAEALTMSDLSCIVCLLYEGLDFDLPPLRDAARLVLAFMVEHGNAREFHCMLKVTLSRVAAEFAKEVQSALLVDLLRLWTTVVPRIPRKRGLFIRDIVDTLDLCYFDQKYIATMDDDDESADDDDAAAGMAASIRPVEKQLLELLAGLAKAQNAQADSDDGFEPLRSATTSPSPSTDAEPGPTSTVESAEQQKSEKQIAKEARMIQKQREDLWYDFQMERGICQAILMKLVDCVVCRFPHPQDAAPNGKARPLSKKKASRPAPSRSTTKLSKGLRSSLVAFDALFAEFGFTGIVDTCQKCYQLLGINVLTDDEAIVREISSPKPGRKRKPETFFSIRSVTCYVAMSLYVKEEYNGSFEAMRRILRESSLGFLTPSYALELMLPYLMHGIADNSPSLALFSLQLARGLLENIPDCSVSTTAEAMRPWYGSGFALTESSWYGLMVTIVQATSGMDNPSHRIFAYETLQAALNKMSRSDTRYVLVTGLLLTSSRSAMVGQLITELKDILRRIDDDGDAEMISTYRSRFVHTCLPRFLLPRKELLAGINPAVTACNAIVYIVIKDVKVAEDQKGPQKYRDDAVARLRFINTYARLGRDAIRGIAATAEHDRKALPESKISKQDVTEAKAMYDAAGRTLNDCIAALSCLDASIDRIADALTEK